MQTLLVFAVVLTLLVFCGTFAISIAKQIYDIKKKNSKDKLKNEEVEK